MAEFCNQCAKTLGLPHGDFVGITTVEEWSKDLAALVLCESCGAIQVDPEGNCISSDCLENHN